MRKHLRQVCSVALILAFATLYIPFLQAQADSVAASDKNPTLPSGLDKRFLDTAADPCVNFAQYSCGKFAKLYPIPADKSSYDEFDIVSEHTEFALRSLLDKVKADTSSRTPNEQKTGDFYATCMDTEAIQLAGLKPFQPYLDRIAALKDQRQLTDILAGYQLFDANAFFNLYESQDFKDARKQIAVLDQGGLGLPERDYYLRSGDAAEKTRQQYVQHLANMLKLVGETDAKAATDAQNIMALETALAKISMDVTSRRDPSNIYHPMKVSQLDGLTPQISWTEFFQLVGAPSVSELNVVNPEFFKGLSALLQSTDMETIRAYLRWQFINSIAATALPAALDAENFNFYHRQLRGQQEDRARWKRCADETDTAVGEALGEVYAHTYFAPESKAKTAQMVRDIEDAMNTEVGSLSWMSPITKDKAREKLRMVADKVGYPEHWRDYSSLRIVRGDGFGNTMRAIEFDKHRQLAKIGKPVDRGEWGMTPPTVNAYYNPLMNDINFPAGILQSPFFSAEATDAQNYGHAGAIVGHELTHGFDDQGRKFDGHGNLSNWWTDEDARKYEAMTDCEVKEYGGFTAVDDLKINGKLTLGENTADNAGLRLALIAFELDAKRKGIDLDVKDDSGFTPMQQFFLADGQNWCGSDRPEQLRLQVQTDEHSPDPFRINGVMQNMPEFGKAFGCKAAQPMMPVNACRVW